MKAGASCMWASCCGLLNEVMGTGAVRGQQAGFGGAGPFRFAPSAGYSTYPPNSSSLVCQACRQTFSVFRRRHLCCDCKKSFCSLCSVLQENLRRCATCHLLNGTAFQRPRLMRLRVKDLRQYLTLRNINTDTCREKEDLVDLVLCHQGAESEDDPDTPTLQTRPLYSSSTADPAPLLSPSHGEPISRSDSSGSTSQVSPAVRRSARASLSDLSSLEDVEQLTIRQLKEILARNFVSFSGCCEKWELVERVRRLYRENEDNRKSRENVSSAVSADEGRTPLFNDENLCRICMDAVIDCVLLECGHMVTCTKCGKRMNECPICRQYVIRAVHVFKS
ncbi:E3 ubiquitin-protein ligase RNF34a isoform X2 [Colossoma macropomum]|uniref:E3 ubiquitin-protein ligase RNF34a isoform X2 n=1 Tax=Colossoma macropomum TaxID=42526 RepID=UPI001864859E|nr:E3 ubiquitin-protein ligase RNF34a isoform X2 [Colossoma macropomum]